MQPTVTVSQFVTIMNETLEQMFSSIDIVGEVASFKVWNQQLAFFDLKDETAVINCMVPLEKLHMPIEAGMQVHINAMPKVTRRGRLSVTVRRVEPLGEGALRRTYELLKVALEAEGLFSPERKRSPPRFPERIGLITSLESAAYRDFITTLNQRWGGIEVVTLHVQVQGEGAVEQIVTAVRQMNQAAAPVDVLVITRGGGSFEDLAVFNSEPIVRAIAASRAPTIAGIGHEIDTTLAELAADIRASTPTDAARRAVPDAQTIKTQTARLQRTLEQNMHNRLQSFRHNLESSLPRLLGGIDTTGQKARVLGSQQRLVYLQRQLILRYMLHLQGLKRALQSYDPERVLKRGYAVVRRNRTILRTAGDVSVDDPVMIQLAKGRLSARVTNVEDS